MNGQQPASGRLFWIAGAALLGLCIAYMMAAGIWRSPHHEGGTVLLAYVVGTMLAGAIYLLAVWSGRRVAPGIAAVFFFGLAMRLVLIASPPLANATDDYYRYLWDGWAVTQGLNPYQYSPSQALEAIAEGGTHDPRLAKAALPAEEVLRGINHADLTTIYPPVAQAAFALAAVVKPFSVYVLRGLLLVSDLATFGLLLTLLRRLRVNEGLSFLYWWNPILLKWMYAEAHMDLFLFPFLLLAIVAALSYRPVLAGASLALATGVKLWPIVLLPLVIWHLRGDRRRMVAAAFTTVAFTLTVLSPMVLARPTASEGLWTYASTWENNDGIYSLVEGAFSPMAAPQDARLYARWTVGALLVVWIPVAILWQSGRPHALMRSALLVVAGVFLLSPTQFPWYYAWILPLVAFWPAWPVLAYTVVLPLYDLTAQYPWLAWVQHLPFWILLAWSARASSRSSAGSLKREWKRPEGRGPAPARVAVIIPALNEESAIGNVLRAIPAWVSQIIVVDNGSTDRTSAVARAAGAQVVQESRRGYGAACLAGIRVLEQPDIVVFLDGDSSDSPSEMERLVAPIRKGQADFVIGSRRLGRCEPGALTPQQRFGNALACTLIRMLWGWRYTDLGPFRAIRYDALQALEMNDTNYGWTVQMQLRAVRLRLTIQEAPVSYRRRIGVSKVSGTIRGVLGAGTKILSLIVREKFWQSGGKQPSRERLIIFARYPESGKTKTRLIPHLGGERAASLQDAMTTHTLNEVTRLVERRRVNAEVRFTGGDEDQMAGNYGRRWSYVPQGEGDLGERLTRGIQDAFAAAFERVVIIGTDCPGLTAELMERAFEELESADVVLGPATDGGYYLVGLREPNVQLFSRVAWGTDAVLDQTLTIAKQLKLSIRLLATLQDVDRPEDIPTWEQMERQWNASRRAMELGEGN